MWNRSYTASWGDVYTHFLFWASFFLEYFFENPAQKRINLAFLSTFLSKLIPFEQFIPFLSTFLSTFLSNIQQKNFFEHFFEYSKMYSRFWVLFWVLFWELFWEFFWDFYYDKTYLELWLNDPGYHPDGRLPWSDGVSGPGGQMGVRCGGSVRDWEPPGVRDIALVS